MNLYKIDTYLKLSFILTIGLIGSVFILQYGFNILPCKLCLMQRYPYYVILVLLAIFYSFKLNNLQKYFIYFISLCFFATAAIAFYHSLVEIGYITTELHCASSALFDDFVQMQKSIIGRPAVSCDVAAFKIMFLSLSNWNFIAALAWAAVGIVTIIKNK